MTNIENLEKTEEVNSNIINLQIKLIKENQKYNSTVCSIGYISMLAILCYTHEYISTRSLFFILLLFGISVFLFVAFEIIKTFRTNAIAKKQFMNYKKYIDKNLTKVQLIDENNYTWQNTWKWFSIKLQYCIFGLSAITGFFAGIILFIQIFREFIK